MNKEFNDNELNLIRRYLVWCYKTTKEDLDRIDRYFTQFTVDSHLLESLKKEKVFKSDMKYKDAVKQFEQYMHEKIDKARQKKFVDNKEELNTEYVYLQNRMVAIENTISKLLGEEMLKEIVRLYEEEMTVRILQAREH
ncbi:MAG: hypothetical protein H6755_05065 [Candidatus Omnitrophica bacterium]|nr:hypothetical protein [Candidatus Omnitrophota bacterium]MCB9747762.1 hypothetical protein [Candidatus Omnitrophota bacterium]